MNYDYEREDGLHDARRKLMGAVLASMAERCNSSILVAIDTSDIDAAARGLVAKLNEPEHCQSCKQVLPHDVA